MEDDANYEPLVKALSGADPIQARRFAAAKALNTAEFAVESIREWWNLVGKYRYAECKNLLICADGGGSNGSRKRSWKFFLQDLADEIGIAITVCHFPPGTSKWNKIEQCMFSFISMNWRGNRWPAMRRLSS